MIAGDDIGIEERGLGGLSHPCPALAAVIVDTIALRALGGAPLDHHAVLIVIER